MMVKLVGGNGSQQLTRSTFCLRVKPEARFVQFDNMYSDVSGAAGRFVVVFLGLVDRGADRAASQTYSTQDNVVITTIRIPENSSDL